MFDERFASSNLSILEFFIYKLPTAENLILSNHYHYPQIRHSEFLFVVVKWITVVNKLSNSKLLKLLPVRFPICSASL